MEYHQQSSTVTYRVRLAARYHVWVPIRVLARTWLLLLIAACDGRRAREPRVAVPSSPPPSFLKGQLHAHTGSSGDSATPPAEVVRWYAAHGYDFVVLTDHNVVTSVPDAYVRAVVTDDRGRHAWTQPVVTR